MLTPWPPSGGFFIGQEKGVTVAEPSTSAGVSLTVLAVAALGPMVGPYALIVFAALAGAMWPLTATPTPSRSAGAFLLLRCTLTAVLLTGLLAGLLGNLFGVPASEALAPVALLIGAIGNGWRQVFSAIVQALGVALNALAGRAGNSGGGGSNE